MQPARVGEVVDQRVKRSGKSHEEAGKREGDPDVALDRDAEETRPALVLANGNHGPPERRPQDECHDGHGDGKTKQDEVIKRIGVRQDIDREEAEIDRLAGEAAQTVVAAGHRAPLERDVIKHLSKRDRDHGKIDAAPAHEQHAQEGPGDAAEQHARE